MMPLKKEQGRAAGLGDSSYTPIAQALYHCIVVSCVFSSHYYMTITIKLFMEM